MAAFTSSSSSVELPPQHHVFINFHGNYLRFNFVAHLVKALEINEIKVVIDKEEHRCQQLVILFNMIEKSRIALVILSENYTKSKLCLMELAKINDCADEGNLMVIPIFYKLDPSTVSDLRGQFGDAVRDLRKRYGTMEIWEKALKSICYRTGIIVDKNSSESDKVVTIVREVKRVLMNINTSERSKTSVSGEEKDKTFGIKQRLNELKQKLDLNKITSQLGMIIGCLLLLFFVIAYMSTSFIGTEGGAINKIVENVPKVLEYIPVEEPENSRDKYAEFHAGKYGAKPERSSSDSKTNADFLDRTFTMDSEVKPPKIQVFINFRGEQLRNNFVGYLVDALRRNEINVFIDNQVQRGEDLNTLFKRIEESGIAIVVFSSRYTESKWCLEELVRIKERVHQGLLKVLPIYYKVTPTNVKRLKGEFGDHFRDKEYKYEFDEPMIKRWKEAIMFVSHKFALTLDEKSSALEIDFVETIVKEVLRMLQAIPKVESVQSSH